MNRPTTATGPHGQEHAVVNAVSPAGAPRARLAPVGLGAVLDAGHVLALQRTVGNSAVVRYLARAGPNERDAGAPDGGTATVERDGGGAGLTGFLAGFNEAALDSLATNPQLLRSGLEDAIAADGLEATRAALADLRDEIATLRGNRSDISGVTPELEEISKKIERREKFLAAADEILAKYVGFFDLFEAQGLLTMQRMLRLSEDRIAAEQARYGLATDTQISGPRMSGPDKELTYDVKTTYSMQSNDQTAGLKQAAGSLAAKVDAIRSATDARNAAMGMVPGPGPDHGFVYGIKDPAAHARGEQLIKEAYREYDLLRYAKEAEFPVLAAFTEIDRHGGTNAIDQVAGKLRTVGAGGQEAAKTLNTDTDDRLEKIRKVRDAITEGDVNVWQVPDVVALVRGQMGVSAGSARARMIDDRVADVEASKLARDILLGAFAIALGVAAAPLTGGASLGFGAAAVAGTAAVAGAALSAYVAVEHLQEYQLEQAMAGTDFDRARALSQTDPSLFWLALDIVGAVIDAKAAIGAFKTLAVTARTAVHARRAATTAEQIAKVEANELAKLRKAADAELKTAGAGEQVVKSAEKAAAAEQAQLAGLAAKWESELSDDAKKLLQGPLGNVYRTMDPEVRALLTHEGNVVKTVTEAQARKLRSVLDRIPPKHKPGLDEFLRANADNLDDAIRDLDELFSPELGKSVDASFENGKIVSGEMVSGSRKGDPNLVPDLTKDIPLDLLKRTQNVLNRKISDAPPSVLAAWNQARTKVLAKGPLTATNYPDLYKEAQKEFWKNVRADTGGAAKWFQDNGFSFTSTQSGAAAVDLPFSGRGARKEYAIELDHILPKGTGQNWTRALDADNLRFLTGWDNWLLNEIDRLGPQMTP